MFYFVSLIVFALDRAVKFLVVKTLEPVGSVQFLKSPLYFTYVSNTGVAFGFFRANTVAISPPARIRASPSKMMKRHGASLP